MTKEEQDKKIEEASELLVFLDTPGGAHMLKLIEDTIAAIPCDVVDFVGASPAGMSLDTTRIAFSAGGKTYLKEVLRRVDEIREFIKKIAMEKEKESVKTA